MASRKRWMLQPLSWRRGGAVALVVLIGVAAAALVLDARAGGEFTPVIERLKERGTEPLALVEEAGRAGQIVILADVHGRAGPKRLAAEAIGRLADGPGLDAVLLEVPSSEQRYIDAYLVGVEDDATRLLSRAAAVQEWYGMPREYLEVYRAVRAANEGRSASERIRVIAGDVDAWPPAEGVAPRDIGEVYAGRAQHMLNRLDQELFSIMPDARVLVFVDGYLALQDTHGLLRFGGGEPVRVEWLGDLLRRRSGARARTILVDAGSQVGAVQRLPNYRGTRMHRSLRRELDGTTAARVAWELAEVEDPVLELSTPGLSLQIRPEGYTLGQVAQGYIFLPGGR